VLFAAESLINVRKGFHHLTTALAAMKQTENLLLVSVGGSAGGKFELPAGLPHLALGRVNNDLMLSTIYSAADVFVIPSLQESFGQTVIESLACGTPVVAYRGGSVAEVIEDGVTGFVVDNMDQAIDAACRVHTLERRACRDAFTRRFSASRMASAYVRLYRQLTSSAAGAGIVA